MTQPTTAWDELLAGYSIINDGTVDLPQQPKVQIVGATSIVDDPTNNQTIVTIPSSGSLTPTGRVSFSGPGTLIMTPYKRHEISTGGGAGATIVKFPTGQAAGVRIFIKIRTACDVNDLTITAQAGGTVEKLLEDAGIGGVYATSTLASSAGDIGSPLAFECDGANNWEAI